MGDKRSAENLAKRRATISADYGGQRGTLALVTEIPPGFPESQSRQKTMLAISKQ